MKGRTRRAFLTADHCGPERSGWHENMHKKRAPGRMNGPTCGTSAFGAIHATGESSRAAVGEMEFRFYVQAFSVRCAHHCGNEARIAGRSRLQKTHSTAVYRFTGRLCPPFR